MKGKDTSTHCRVCEKKLKKNFRSLSRAKGEPAPKIGELVDWGGEKRPVIEVKMSRYSFMRDVDEYDVWLGDVGHNANGHFCTYLCAMRFALAAFRAGYRMKK